MLAALVAAALAVGVRPASAQEADVLTGRVLGDDGKPVQGARVEAMEVESEISRSVLTNAQGRYLILFPDGTGQYVVRVTMLGLADQTKTVGREAEEELLLTDFAMTPQAIPLEGIIVRAPLPPTGAAGAAGEQSTALPAELLNRLPLPDLDPSTLALLAAGVTSTGLDSLTGRVGFSVAGMSEQLNQIMLDGVILGQGGLNVPEEGVRRTLITTSTYDAARGGFAGGQVTMTTARGNNRSSGALSYRLDNDALQFQSSATTNAFTRQNLGGSWGGALLRNSLFYNGSFQLQHNIDHRFALDANDPLAAQRSGVSADSIGRFLGILENGFGVPVAGQTGPYGQLSKDVRLQGRVDWNVFQRQGTAQTLSTRFNVNLNTQDSTRIATLDLVDHGGDQERSSWLGSLNLTSRFGGRWTNQLNASASHNWSETVPYIEMPQGQVRVTSDFGDGTRGTRSLNFGGNRSMPSEARSTDLQISDDFSFILPVATQLHRLKVGGSLQHDEDRQRSTDNIFGTYTFASLADFEANRPDMFERSLSDRTTNSARNNVGAYIGDTWRVTVPLELTLGLRWDRSSLDERPEYNPRIEELFGRRTDIEPAASGLSPRLGFNYRLNQQGQPPRALSGGIGWFAGRAPSNLFATAVRQTGLPDAEQRLVCIGPAVPIPDWDALAGNPDAIATECAGGARGQSPLASRAPTVTLIDPTQRLPASLRLDLGYRTRLPLGISGNFRYQYSIGSGLWSYRDLNLDESRTLVLAGENRIFFGSRAAIVPATGAVSSVASRVHPELASVFDITSTGKSVSHQLTAQLSGTLPGALTVSANYTLGFTRDQGAGSFGQTNTAADPNRLEWATAGNDRRHNLNLVLTRALAPWVEVTAMGRISSGAPFTPMINRDVNGDGVRNDRAFLFDPATTADTAVANAMTRLLGDVPARVRQCLQSQLGTIAARNSCRDSWSQSLDLRASLRPNLPAFDERMTISIDARNVLTGLDQLVHGADDMHGWGEGQRADANLLEVKAFDPARNAFVYDVNEGFGQTRRGPNAFRNGFSITISARVALGFQQIDARGFGDPRAQLRGLGAFGAGPGGGGGLGGGGGGGGLGGGLGGGFGGGGGPDGGAIDAAGAGQLLGLLRGEAVDIPAMLNGLLPNPVRDLVELRESLYLTDEQVTQLRAISDSLQTRLDRRHATLAEQLQTLVPPGGIAAGIAAGGAGREVVADVLGRMQSEIRPQLDSANVEVQSALAAARAELGPEQLANVPQRLRQAPQAIRAVQGAVNALALLDRMLANPIPVLLELKDLALTDDQMQRLRTVASLLQEKLDKRRADLGKRFDAVSGPDQLRLLAELRPQLDAGREEITAALRGAQKILTPAQWVKVPAQVKDPFAGAAAQNERGQGTGQGAGQGRGQGGGGPQRPPAR